MKKLILIIVVLFSLFASLKVEAQSYNKNLSSYAYLIKRGTFDSTLIMPYHDTTLNSGLIRAGAVVLKSSNHALCIYNGSYWDMYMPQSSSDLSKYWDSTKVKNYVGLYVDDFIDGRGFLTMETDPIYSTSIASNISAADTLNWDSAYVGSKYYNATNYLVFRTVSGKYDSVKLDVASSSINKIAYNPKIDDTLRLSLSTLDTIKAKMHLETAIDSGVYVSSSNQIILYRFNGSALALDLPASSLPIVPGQGITYNSTTGKVSTKLSAAGGNALTYDGGGGLYVPQPISGTDTTVKGVIYNPKVDDTIRLTTNTLDTIRAAMHLNTAIDSGVFISATNQMKLFRFNGDSIVLTILGGAVTSVNTLTGNVQLNLSIAGRKISLTNGGTVTVPHDSLNLSISTLKILNSNSVDIAPIIKSIVHDSVENKLSVEIDPVWLNDSSNYYNKTDIDAQRAAAEASFTALINSTIANYFTKTESDARYLQLGDTIYLSNRIENKVDKIAGKELSSNDFTDADSTKLKGIAAGAEVNVNADWNAVSGDAEILNKPSIPAQYAPVEGNGISITGTYPGYIITNTKPDQAVTLTEGSNITITGTYPNFTISSTGGGSGGGSGISQVVGINGIANKNDSTVYLDSAVGMTHTQFNDSIEANSLTVLGPLFLNPTLKIMGVDTSRSTGLPTLKVVDSLIAANAGTGDGDMLKSIYDPTGVNNDAFDYNNLHNKPTLFSGSYLDLTNKPTILSHSDIAPQISDSLLNYPLKSGFNLLTSDTTIKIDGSPKVLGTGNIRINPNLIIVGKPLDSIDYGGGGSNTGTVKSVGFSADQNIFVVQGSPITDSGTINLAWTGQNSHMVFAGPAADGNTLGPIFRLLVPGDIPSLAASKINSGTFSTARLGTGTASAGKYVDGGTGAWTTLPSVTPVNLGNADILQSDATRNFNIAGGILNFNDTTAAGEYNTVLNLSKNSSTLAAFDGTAHSSSVLTSSSFGNVYVSLGTLTSMGSNSLTLDSTGLKFDGAGNVHINSPFFIEPRSGSFVGYHFGSDYFSATTYGGLGSFKFDSTGSLYLPQLSSVSSLATNSAGKIIPGTVNTGGTFTPTISNKTSNISDATIESSYYIRIGNVVSVDFAIQITNTNTTTGSNEFDLTVPVTSAFTSVFDATGSLVTEGVEGDGEIRSNSSTSTIHCMIGTSTNNTRLYHGHYMMIVK